MNVPIISTFRLYISTWIVSLRKPRNLLVSPVAVRTVTIRYYAPDSLVVDDETSHLSLTSEYLRRVGLCRYFPAGRLFCRSTIQVSLHGHLFSLFVIMIASFSTCLQNRPLTNTTVAISLIPLHGSISRVQVASAPAAAVCVLCLAWWYYMV
ncbi:hypothetical protein F4824DRAFT_284273 [Ustulina deusta]|nr:hypothetical protein F4824DRAFT_284273 [Ustulina deusta]